MTDYTEGSAIIPLNKKAVSKKLPVFYNPIMKFNRDCSVALLNALNRKELHIADLLAGSGIRSIRFAQELNSGIVKTLCVNDYSKDAVESIKSNLKRNKVEMKKITVTNEEANDFLLQSSGFDYIDIDPFGTPNPFLDSAVKRIARDGILAITATDTSSLAGTYPKACKRKYWATPLRNYMKHEIGLRILIRKVQLIGMQYEKALVPVFSYSRDHYYRVFFQCLKKKKECDKIVKQHSMFENAGPLWIGQLHDKKLVKKMLKLVKDEDNLKFVQTMYEEAHIVGFVDLHQLSKETKKHPKKTHDVIRLLKLKTYEATPTHFCPHGIKTNAPKNVLRNL
jgi:tRNA (guanine26-N2/guanine27-N2)-dimethyltransferase